MLKHADFFADTNDYDLLATTSVRLTIVVPYVSIRELMTKDPEGIFGQTLTRCSDDAGE